MPEINVRLSKAVLCRPLCPGTAWSLCGHHSGSSGERNFQSLFKCFMDGRDWASLRRLWPPIGRI